MVNISITISKPNPSAFDNINVYELAKLLGETKRALEAASKSFDEIYPQISKIKEMINDFEDIDEKMSTLKQKVNNECCYILSALVDVEDYDDIEFSNPDDTEDLACFVYYILNEEKDKVKIGISNNPISRAKNLQTASGEDIEILHTIKFKNREEASEAERCLHKEFSTFRKRPSKVAKSCEWFDARIVDILMKNYTSREDILNLERQRRLELLEAMNKFHLVM